MGDSSNHLPFGDLIKFLRTVGFLAIDSIEIRWATLSIVFGKQNGRDFYESVFVVAHR